MSGEPVMQFLDTNILVYAHDHSAGQKHEIAAGLVRLLWEDRQGRLSVQVLQEFFVTITRKAMRPLSAEAASEIIAQLSFWRVHRPGARDVVDAITLHARYGISFWDAMIIQSASRMGCRVVWSEDLGEGQQYGNVIVRNPFSLPIES
jgi:predicted nucleic acid-binding protein